VPDGQSSIAGQLSGDGGAIVTELRSGPPLPAVVYEPRSDEFQAACHFPLHSAGKEAVMTETGGYWRKLESQVP
jgi:hypothetical protein